MIIVMMMMMVRRDDEEEEEENGLSLPPNLRALYHLADH